MKKKKVLAKDDSHNNAKPKDDAADTRAVQDDTRTPLMAKTVA